MRTHVAALDGLRGVAVAAVVAYHVRPDWVPGGFLGVDLFFVLSGYLITSLLLEEHERAGRVDLLAFAGRRLRRLLPAVLVVVMATAVYVNARGDFGEIERMRRHGLATIGYVANWLFILDGDSYFADVVGPSMLRHVWSLAIEEQFYLLWPLATWAALRLAGRRGVAAVALGVGTVSVVLMALWFEAADPSRVYFGTDTRIFEPLVGAAVAAVLPLRAAKPSVIVRFGGGAAAVWLAAVLLVDDRWDGFYRGGALAIAGVVAVVLVAATVDGRLARLLAWRPLVALGAISYGVYLWHWPLLIGARREGWTGPWADALVVVATLVVSAASHRLVETPIRRSTRLVAWRPVVVAVGAMAVFAVAVVGLTRTTIPAEAVSVDEAIEDAIEGSRPGGPTEGPADAIAAHEPLVVVLIGDSSAWTLGGGLVSWGLNHGPYDSPFDPDRIELVNLARKGYRLVPGATTDFGEARERPFVDRDDEAWWRETVASVQPNLVVALFGLSDLQSRVVDGTVVDFESAAFADLLEQSADELLGDLAASAPVVVLTSPPLIGAHMPQPVMSAFFDEFSAARAERLNALLQEVARDHPRISMFAFAEALCPGDGPDHGCLLADDGQPARHDGVHFTEPGARLAAALLTDALEAAAGLSDPDSTP